MATKDIPQEFQAYCTVAGDLLDTRIAKEKDLTAEYEGQTYYFCCPPCKPTFLANPAKYASGKAESSTMTFVEKVHVSGNVWSFSFKPEAAMSWKAGQYVRIEVAHDNADKRGSKRWFTISSAPYEQILTITTRLSGSTFKQALDALNPGDTIQLIDQPSGSFVWDSEDTGDRVFVVGGIGITPLHSILKQRQYESMSLSATVLYVNRAEADIPFKDFLDSLSAEGINVEYFSADEITAERIIEASGDGAQVYLSGAKPMVQQLAKELVAYGVASEDITSDEFVHYDITNY